MIEVILKEQSKIFWGYYENIERMLSNVRIKELLNKNIGIEVKTRTEVEDKKQSLKKKNIFM